MLRLRTVVRDVTPSSFVEREPALQGNLLPLHGASQNYIRPTVFNKNRLIQTLIDIRKQIMRTEERSDVPYVREVCAKKKD